MRQKYDAQIFERESNAVLVTLLDMIDHSAVHEIQGHALDEMIAMTRSKVGLLYLVDTVAESIHIELASVPGTPAHAVYPQTTTNIGWSGYWSACLASGRPVIRNHRLDFGTPISREFATLNRELTIPVYDNDDLVAVILIGERVTQYDAIDVMALQYLAEIMWRVTVRKQLFDKISDEVK